MNFAYLDLLLAVLLGGLGLVQPGEPTVVPLVQPPGLLDAQLGLADLLEDGGQGLLGALQHRGVSHVERVSGRLQGLTTGSGLLHSCNRVDR